MRNLLSVFSSKKPDPLTAIILFVAIVVVLEFEFSFLASSSELLESFRVNRVASGAPPDWQIMGDSVAQGGITASQLATYLPGETVSNQAMCGTGPEFYYFVLKRQVAAGKAPKKIIFAPSAHIFPLKKTALLVGGFCTWPEAVEVAKTGIYPSKVLYGMLCKLSFTLRNREALRRSFQVAVPNTGANLEAQFDRIHRAPFEVEKANSLFLNKFLILARENNIPIFWVTMPVRASISESRKPLNFDPVYYRFLHDMEKGFDVRVVQKEFLLLEDHDFEDNTHLNSSGAQHFTTFLGEKLSAHLQQGISSVDKSTNASVTGNPRVLTPH